jgi:hypothetical protein
MCERVVPKDRIITPNAKVVVPSPHPVGLTKGSLAVGAQVSHASAQLRQLRDVHDLAIEVRIHEILECIVEGEGIAGELSFVFTGSRLRPWCCQVSEECWIVFLRNQDVVGRESESRRQSQIRCVTFQEPHCREEWLLSTSISFEVHKV